MQNAPLVGGALGESDDLLGASSRSITVATDDLLDRHPCLLCGRNESGPGFDCCRACSRVLVGGGAP